MRTASLPCPPSNQQMYGSDQIKSADQVRQQRDNRSDWPYEHLFPPANSTPVNQITLTPAVVPAMGSQVLVLAYKVPSGKRFILTGVIENIFGVSFTPGDGTWTIDKNTPIGIPDSQKMPMQGLVNTPVQLGSFASGRPWRFPRPYEFEPLDLVQSKFSNVVGIGGGTLLSAFLGYLIPVVGLSR